MKDPYETLGVSPEASADEIKKAYRRLAKKYHPDSTGGDKTKEEQFKDVSTAYDVLGDATKRQQFDSMRQSGFAGVPGAENGTPMDLGELFSQMFGGGPATGGRGKRPSVEYRVYSDAAGPSGFSNSGFAGFPGFGAEEVPPRRRRKSPETETQERNVQAADGSKLIQRGNNVHSDVRLLFDQAVLGALVDVPTLSGKANVKIPPGTSSGVKLRLKGKGARGPQGELGDHIVTVQIDVPKNIDDEATKLLAQFMRRVRRNP